MKKTMIYELELKRGLNTFAKVQIEVDPTVLRIFFQDEESDEYDLERMEEHCNEHMFDLEKAINSETGLRAHVNLIAGLAGKSMAEKRAAKMGLGKPKKVSEKKLKRMQKKAAKKWLEATKDKKSEKKLKKDIWDDSLVKEGKVKE